MKKETIKAEKNALTSMIDAIQAVNKTDIKLAGENTDWYLEKFRLYQIATNLAIKIMLHELGIRVTKKRVILIENKLEEGNLHCPVEAIFNLEEELTSSYPMEIWHPEGETLNQHYLREVNNILKDYDLTACTNVAKK